MDPTRPSRGLIAAGEALGLSGSTAPTASSARIQAALSVPRVELPASETSFVHVGPTRVRVRTVGDGPPLLMMMGIGGNLDMWEPLERHLPGRRLVMFDFPGTGGSGVSWLPPTMAYNALFTQLLLRRLGYRRVDVLGYSWGGVLAQHLAFQHPRSVRRLILASTTVGLGGVPPSPRVVARMLTPRRYYSRPYFARIAPSVYGGRYRRDPTLIDPEIRRRLERPPTMWGYATQLIAIMNSSTLPVLPFVSAPTLILAGDDDPIISTVNPRVMSRLLRHSTLRVISGAGHLMLLDSAELIAPLIEAFLVDERSAERRVAPRPPLSVF